MEVARALNSTCIGMYKGIVLGFVCAHSFIHLDLLVSTPFVSAGKPCKVPHVQKTPQCSFGAETQFITLES